MSRGRCFAAIAALASLTLAGCATPASPPARTTPGVARVVPDAAAPRAPQLLARAYTTLLETAAAKVADPATPQTQVAALAAAERDASAALDALAAAERARAAAQSDPHGDEENRAAADAALVVATRAAERAVTAFAALLGRKE
ncbi:MAG: hypothetical protein KJS97_01585 [Alphaproteobacteria bacterium]|nr:hypothetical protein [Alphaproteobacteria bacterium]